DGFARAGYSWRNRTPILTPWGWRNRDGPLTLEVDGGRGTAGAGAERAGRMHRRRDRAHALDERAHAPGRRRPLVQPAVPERDGGRRRAGGEGVVRGSRVPRAARRGLRQPLLRGP